ncbi:NAD(P)/FAD-dependent oxidoreductase [Streptomyces sp. NPDC059070]|uniref:NAD(P)/FAD-dependent oxidoreductase n=1 Tax=unclassified Streptomyces TaxID=2593676 RepID=UPI0034E205AC
MAGTDTYGTNDGPGPFDAVVAGGSVAGLAGALALAGTGRRVLVLERGAPPPDGPAARAAERWTRPGVPQGVHSHTLTSLGVRVLRERAPQVLAALLAAGAELLDLTAAAPPGTVRESADAELVALGCRRATLELVLHRLVSALPGVTVRHGRAVAALELDPDDGRVRAVRTDDGARVPTALVVDATGRRAAARGWLRAAGVPVAEDLVAPSGLSGYTRFYRLTGSARPGPLNRGNAAGDIFDHCAGVLHPGDNGTFSVALATLPGDRALHGLLTPAGFTAMARAVPGLAPWLAEGVSEPVSAVHAITSPSNALRGTATSRQRPVPGLFPLGDAACVTNPLFGRGMSLAFAHAFRLADVLTAHPVAGTAQSRAAARAAEELLLPWYEQSAQADRERIARWRRRIDTGADASPAPGAAVASAARRDPAVWRGLTRMLMGLTTPGELAADPAFLAGVERAASAPVPPAGPERRALVRLVAEAEGVPR